MPDPRELPDTRTPLTLDEAAHAIVHGWRCYFGGDPKRESLLVLLAQSALETGRWSAIHCFNFGNIKSAPGDGRSWTFFRCNELLDGKWCWFDPPHPQTRFRAYDSAEEGAVDYVALLVRRYTAAWGAVTVGDPGAFVDCLKRGMYFTAPIEPYRRNVISLFREFDKALTLPDPPELTLEEQARVIALRDLARNEAIAEQVEECGPTPQP